jgi:predicted membrane protein
MSESSGKRADMKVLIGSLIVIAGVFQILNNLVLNMDFNVWEWWPLVLVAAGLYGMTSPRYSRDWAGSLFVAALGALLLLKNLDIIHFSIFKLWPLLLIFLGIAILKQGLNKERMLCNDDSQIALSWILGGGECRADGKKLTGGRVSIVMGGGTLDFRDAEMKPDEMVLDVSIVIGGLEIRIPEHWKPVVQCSPFIGGVEDATGKRSETRALKTLILKGSVFLGGVEIK